MFGRKLINNITYHILAMMVGWLSIVRLENFLEDWKTYSSHLEFYFIANDVEEPIKQRAILLSVLSVETLPQALSEFTFKDLVAKVTEHYDQKSSWCCIVLSLTVEFITLEIQE